MRNKVVIFIINLLLFLFLDSYTVLTFWESLACSLMLYFLLEFLDNLGNKVIIMDLAILMAILTCLFMPMVFYHTFTKENHLARLWVKYMPIPSDTYFSFALPAIMMMILGLRIPLRKLHINTYPKIYLDNAKEYLKGKTNLGLTLIVVGVISGLFDFLSPDSLKQVFYFATHLTYVGVFYVLYSPSKHKKYIVPGVIALMIGQSVITGMFGDFIFMLASALTLFLLGTKFSFRSKLIFAICGIFLIIIIQSVKVDYRTRSWKQGTGADPVFFATLIVDRLINVENLVNTDNLFFTSVRMNQGWLVALTMKRVPEHFPFAYGETIFNSVAGAIIPRFLWPDKPESGGKANLKRFWGYDLRGFSMNIGPLGEAYANFEVLGGIIFMFFYGLFFNYALSSILKFSEKRPTIVLWLPFLFFYAISMETDLLTTMGSLIKGLIFTWIVFKLFRIAFRIDL
jgi:hypothetical protein